MIPSSRKVDKTLFKTLVSKGKWVNSDHFNGRVLLLGGNYKSKISVVVPKKLEKSAVKRNVLKRRLYSVVRNCLGQMVTGSVCALFVKKGFSTKELTLLKKEVSDFMVKAKLVS